MLQRIVALVSLVTVSLGHQTFTCPEPVTLNGPFTIIKQYVPRRTFCTFRYNIPEGDIADVYVTAYGLLNGSIKVEGTFDSIGSKGRSSFYLKAPFSGNQVRITLDTASDTNVLFEYEVSNRTIVFPPSSKQVQVTENETASFLRFSKGVQSFTVVSETNISLVASAPPNFPPTSLLNVLLFEDDGEKKVLIGSLNSIFNHTIFEATKVIFYIPTWTDELTELVVIANHPTNLEHCTGYFAHWWSSGSLSPENLATWNFMSKNGFKCVTLLNEYEEEFDANLGRNFIKATRNAPIFLRADVVVAYNGFDAIITAGAPFVDYNSTTLARFGTSPSITMPQHFPGYARTIMVRNGTISFQFKSEADEDAKYLNTRAYNGRQGYIMSNNYKMPEKDQNIGFVLSEEIPFNLTLEVVSTDVPDYSAVKILGDGEAYSTIFLKSAGNISKSWNFDKNFIKVELTTSSLAPFKGTLLRYSIKMNETSTTTTTPRSISSNDTFPTDVATDVTTNSGTTVTTTTTTVTSPTTVTTTTITPTTTAGSAIGVLSILSLMVAVCFF